MSSRTWWGLVGLLIVAALLRIVGLGTLSLTGDESYYWLWSEHLDWAYYDHPAGVALLIRASTALGGPSEVGVRLLNSFLGVGCVLLTYLLGRRALSEQAGMFAAGLLATGAPYLITSRFVYTNVLFLFLQLLNLYSFWHLVEERRIRVKTVGVFGLTLALLFNIKYSAYLYVVGLLVAVFVDHRYLLTERRFWVGMLIGSLGLVPVIVWNSAHAWASFRWQLFHATTNLMGTYSLLGNVRHALAYLTWPLVAVALIGVGQVRNRAERLLSLLALFLLLPVAASAANSPRNLTDGLVPLLLLAGARLPSKLGGLRQWAKTAVLVGAALIVAVYGVGTVASLVQPSPWPHSSIVPVILKDVAGWQELGPILAAYPEPIFAVDYGAAAQAWYYSGRPVYSSWEQYRIWGIPALEDVVIISLDYLPEDLVLGSLDEAFGSVEGPRHLWFTENDVMKEVRIWRGTGLQWSQDRFLRRFDFLTLLEASR